MPQSLSFILVHIVFSTRKRTPFITPEIRPVLNAYRSTHVRNLDCECYRVGGVADHVHLAVRISRDIKIKYLLQEIKTSSSRWLKTKSPDIHDFVWQRGYAAFSVGPTDRDALLHYIDNQESHHKTTTFQDEMCAFFRKYEIEYDERYVWD